MGEEEKNPSTEIVRLGMPLTRDEFEEEEDLELTVRFGVSMTAGDLKAFDKALGLKLIPGASRSDAIRLSIEQSITLAKLSTNEREAIINFAKLCQREPAIVDELLLLEVMRKKT